MKITEIAITVIPGKNEEEFSPIILRRNAKKMWYAENEEGMHPALIDLANQIQQVISKWSN